MGLRDAYIICKAEINTIEEYKVKLENLLKLVEKDEQSSTKNSIYNKKIEDFNRLYYTFRSYAEKVFGNIPYIYNHITKPLEDDLDDTSISIQVVIGYSKEKTGQNKYNKMEEFKKFYIRVQCIISLYETIYGQNEGSIGLDIRIPGTDNLTELKKYIDGLEFVLTKCPFFQSNEESLKLQAVDNGSIWLIFGVAGFSAVAGSILMNNIAKFVKICIDIKNDLKDIRKKEQLLKQSELEQKEKEEIFKSLNKLYKIAVKNAVNEMVRSTGRHLQDGDEQGRAEQSFERMVKLLDKGVQIHSAINSPEEVKELFEPLEQHYLSIEKELEKIEEKLDIDTE